MDEKIRELQRKYAETNSEECAQRYLNIRLRSGEPSTQLIMRYLVRLLVGREPTAGDYLLFLDEQLPDTFDFDFKNMAIKLDDVRRDADYVESRLSNLENQL